IERIGEASYEIGYQLYTKETATLIWEYAGDDEDPGSYSQPQTPENFLYSGETSDFNGNDPENPQLETLTLDELFDRLQNDPTLAGQMAEQLGIENKDAESIIDSLIAQFSPQEAKNPETAEDWFNQGLEQANLGNWSNAIADWEQALTIDPQLASAWHNRGGALAMIGNYEEALNSYDRALEITPNDHQVINARGSALYGLQRWQEALECWQQVLEADDNFYQAWYNRGSTLENLGETQAAIACYQKALGIVPDFELAQTRLEALLGQKPPEDDGNPPA
ncbi:MAG: tetratricopeptide repeat protein, partial [Microcystis sp. 53602_E8]|nr:tetratricopeptide repeat protein [Microcystis sp. 53602_E8]